MKNQITFFLVALLVASLFAPQQIKAQSPPQKISYQAVLRDGNNALIVSTTVGMKISILQGSAGGGTSPVYVETQTPTSNINGLVSLEVGTGTVLTGTFSTINWANGPFYIKTETDPTGGTNYTITGTSQLLSVPYALYSANGTPGPQGPAGTFQNGSAVGEMLYWDGNNWVAVTPGSTGQTLILCHGIPIWGACAPIVGDLYQGGVVFYIFQSGDLGYVSGQTHGLIVSLTDQSTSATWGCQNLIMSGADGTAIGTGVQNTIDIEAGCTESGTAADICANLTLNSYSDWFLPSNDEITQVYQNRNSINVTALANGGTTLSSGLYWSSTELFASAWYYNFAGYLSNGGKNNLYGVRAIRAF